MIWLNKFQKQNKGAVDLLKIRLKSKFESDMHLLYFYIAVALKMLSTHLGRNVLNNVLFNLAYLITTFVLFF